MRVVIIARRAQGINGTGGMERAATEIALGLSRRGHDVELVTSTPAAEAAIDFPFRVTLLPPRQRQGIRGWRDYRPWVQAVARHVEASPPEFIVSFYGDVAALPAGGPPVPLFTYGLEWYLTPGVHGLGLKRLYGPLGLAAIRRADYLGTCGAVHLARLYEVARPQGEAVHLHNWMQPDAGPTPPHAEARAALGLPGDAVVLGVVSRLARDKALDVAVRAVRALRPEFPQLHFVIGGDGPERAALETAADDDPGIRLLGRVDDATARNVMRAADATVSVARTQYQMFAVIEALSLGTPVLCAYAERQEGLIKEGLTGFVLPRPDEASMQRALRRLLTMPAEARAAMEAACLREVARGYTLDDALTIIEATAQRA
ncbi:MAG: glycosyltransferase, partial [Dehalococcoidia bacterium]